ncbi:hypothetical protein AXF42_Ash004242 [Apostasia shenzhenica]|uniref:Secreted protein n=1 Tax=Apostasia shenzhenica TaxID=1088818 RepID=A0A2I0A2B0_9ASPA|nr:hypothetical protein AXF42_Ash004242 [Apostasia shenzhenica]
MCYGPGFSPFVCLLLSLLLYTARATLLTSPQLLQIVVISFSDHKVIEVPVLKAGSVAGRFSRGLASSALIGSSSALIGSSASQRFRFAALKIVTSVPFLII